MERIGEEIYGAKGKVAKGLDEHAAMSSYVLGLPSRAPHSRHPFPN